MYTSFNTLPGTAKVWIYQANRAFSEAESKEIAVLLHDFTEKWDSHGKTLLASFELPYNHFVVLAVSDDVAMASGCSIDKSVGVIRTIEEKFGLSLLDRSLIAYNKENTINLAKVGELKSAVANQLITEDTSIFNNSVTTIAEYNSAWQVEAGASWMKRYFNNVTARK